MPSRFSGMGANLVGNVCSFRLWAPNAREVRVIGDFNGWNEATATFLDHEADGYWSCEVPGVQQGQEYKYIIQNRGNSLNNPGWRVWRVDAYARDVEHSGENANSIIVDPGWRWSPFDTPGFENFIFYQLHIGTFAGYHDNLGIGDRSARFTEIIPKLDYIRELGFNALALLPIGEYYADTGGGYAPTNFFAPESAYGSPDDLRRLVDEAHRRGLSVFFDVVFNHASTEDNRYWDYDGMNFDGGIYFENGGDTPFGRGLAHWKQEIRNFFLDNARMWFREYQADGLRFDATHLIPADAVRQIISGLRSDFPNKYLIAEYMPDTPYATKDLGFHAVWSIEDSHAFQDAANGHDPVAKIRSFLHWFGFDHAWNKVRYLTGSHDEVCDRLDGHNKDPRYLVERFGGRGNWYARAKARLAWALNVASPGTPMLFMGTECHMWGYWKPERDVNGDHRFDWGIAGDPLGMEMRRMVGDVNQVRWNNPALRSDTLQFTHEDDENGVVAFKRWSPDGNILLAVVNLGDRQWEQLNYGVNMGGESGQWEEVFNSQSPQYGGWSGSGNFGHHPWVQNDGRIYINLPKWSVLLFRKH